jgi:hypothetical protein
MLCGKTSEGLYELRSFRRKKIRVRSESFAILSEEWTGNGSQIQRKANLLKAEKKPVVIFMKQFKQKEETERAVTSFRLQE